MSTEQPTIQARIMRDGQLEVVEVAAYTDDDQSDALSKHDEGEQEYSTVNISAESMLNSDETYEGADSVSGKEDQHVLEIDLVNFTLVRCSGESEEGGGAETHYRLMATTDAVQDEPSSSEGTLVTSDGVSCILEDNDGQEILLSGARDAQGDARGATGNKPQQYVRVVEGNDRVPLVFFSSKPGGEVNRESNAAASILEQGRTQTTRKGQTNKTSGCRPCLPSAGWKRKAKDAPPAHELLSSPSFKLFLYSCKQCDFKCNAIKELTQHRAIHAGGGAGRWRGGRGAAGGRPAAALLQCARCPFRAATRLQLTRHSQDSHTVQVEIPSGNQYTVDVFVCEGCGFESSSKMAFRVHECQS